MQHRGAPVHGGCARLCGFHGAHGGAWLSLQPIPCRDNGPRGEHASRPGPQLPRRPVHGPRGGGFLSLTVSLRSGGGPRFHFSRHGPFSLSLSLFIKKSSRCSLPRSSCNRSPQNTLQVCTTTSLTAATYLWREVRNTGVLLTLISCCTKSAEENKKKHDQLQRDHKHYRERLRESLDPFSASTAGKEKIKRQMRRISWTGRRAKEQTAR